MNFIEQEERDPERDLLRERQIKTKTATYTIKCEDPYGFWRIFIDKGQLASKLRGQYTSYDHAKQALETHIIATYKKVEEEKVI